MLRPADGRGRQAWENKTLEIRHEHFASACLSGFLREVREPFDHQARGPRVAAAMFPGDEHESGLMIACVLMAYRGYRVVYLGPNTPVEQIAAAATTGNIEIVALSVSPGLPRRRATGDIGRLRTLLPRGVHLRVGEPALHRPSMVLSVSAASNRSTRGSSASRE